MIAEGRTARRHILVIVNPVAGTGGSARLRAIVDRLRDHGCTVTLYETRSAGDAERFVRDTDCTGLDAIAAAGGDGTINDVLNGLPAHAPPLAILPLGTVNVLAREIGLSPSIEAIVQTVVFGPSRPIALGEANGRRFVVMASVGLDAEVVENVDLDLKRHIGRWAYLVETIKRLFISPPSTYRLRLGGAERNTHGVIIANGRHYAGRYVTSPDAHLQKPCLDVCSLTRPGRLAAPRYFLSLFFGRFAKRADVRIDQATDLDILEPAGAPVQADGDILCRLPASIKVLPAAVDLIFPPPSKEEKSLLS